MNVLSRLAAIAGTVVLTAGAAGCAAGAPVPPPVPPPHLPALPATLTAQQAATLQDYGRADTAFGMDVLGAVCRARPGANLVLSPASLASGLGMAFLGARGGTAAVMSQVLHMPATSPAALVAGLRTRAELLGSLNRPGVTFTVSNRIWADPYLVTNSGYPVGGRWRGRPLAGEDRGAPTAMRRSLCCPGPRSWPAGSTSR